MIGIKIAPCDKKRMFQSEEGAGTQMEVTFPHSNPSGEMLMPADSDKSNICSPALLNNVSVNDLAYDGGPLRSIVRKGLKPSIPLLELLSISAAPTRAFPSQQDATGLNPQNPARTPPPCGHSTSSWGNGVGWPPHRKTMGFLKSLCVGLQLQLDP